MAEFRLSDATKQQVEDFETTDHTFKMAWEAFEAKNRAELDNLDKLREERNAKLDVAVRSLRTEAEAADITKVKTIKQGPFSVQKRWSNFYNQKTIVLLKEHQLWDRAVAAGIVVEKVELGKFEQLQSFFVGAGKGKEFEKCEDGMELTPAVSGPKPIHGFGAEAKERK